MSPTGQERPPVIHEGLPTQLPDIDPEETAEWVSSLDEMIDSGGRSRARYVMLKLLERAREQNVGVPALRSTDFINTIPPEREPWFPGNEAIERRIRSYIRWNAAVMVSRANRPGLGVGGHIATYQSAASLYEVGFNHFFRGKNHPGGGDHLYYQGHAAPGIYARSFLEGRLDEQQLDRFRQEHSHGDGKGLSSYPHPRLMSDYWEFPTVSMGLGAINAIYQARFNRYLHNRGIKDTSQQHVWAFLGDGEMGEVESLGAIGVAAREELDNLTFVINCNLQQLDGPVRGNGKIIQELESYFRGAGWNVIKVVWGREWDDLLARDTDGALVNQMNRTPDGEFQTLSVESGAYNRENFFGPDPRLQKMVEHLSDEDIERLPRGGHDYRKVYAAFEAAQKHTGQPTVILAHTIKGWLLESFAGPQRDAPDEEADQGRPQGLPRSPQHPDLRRPDRRQRHRAVLSPGRGQRRDPVHEGPPRRSRRIPAQARRQPGQHQAARGLDVRRAQEGLGQAADRDDDGVRTPPARPDEGSRDRSAHRADRTRRVPHVRHGLDVPVGQDLQPGRPDVRRRRPQAAARLQGVQAGPAAARGHQRGRRDGVGHRSRQRVRNARRADDPGLHVLFDVRLPADRRLDLGHGRPAGARLPDRRHRRSYDAHRRGTAARRRPLAADRADQPRCRALRPGVRLRDQPHRAVRPRAHVRLDRCQAATAKTSSST